MVHVLSSIRDFKAVTPSDSQDVPSPNRVRGLYVGTSGDVAVIMLGDVAEEVKILPSLAAGIWHSMNVKRVMAAGTTATGIRVGY